MNDKTIKISKTVCFGGYTPEQIEFPLVYTEPRFLELQKLMEYELLEILKTGCQMFYCGMSRGIDLMCADILLDIKENQEEYADIQLVSVFPYFEHGFGDNWDNLHNLIRCCSDEIIVLLPNPTPASSQHCDEFLLSRADTLLCYYDEQQDKLPSIVNMAKQKGVQIVNMLKK